MSTTSLLAQDIKLHYPARVRIGNPVQARIVVEDMPVDKPVENVNNFLYLS